MPNPVKISEDLVKLIEQALARATTLPPARKKDLEAMALQARDLAAGLAHFSNNYMVLETEDETLAANGAIDSWSSISYGSVSGGNLVPFVKSMDPLRRLHRAGLDIKSVYRYSPQEVEFARFLGHNFSVLARTWTWMKKEMVPSKDGKINVAVLPQQLSIGRKFVRQIQELGLAEPESTKYLVKGGQWEDFDLTSPLPRKKIVTRVRTAMKRTGDNSSTLLFTGLWLNAYVEDLVRDHMERNEREHGIFTNVVFQTPPEIKGMTSDFDVLVQVGQCLTAFECKGGYLFQKKKKTQKGQWTVQGAESGQPNNELKKVIEHAEILQQVVELTGADVEMKFVLVFNPQAVDRESLEAALAGKPVEAVTPDQIRGLLQQVYP